MYIPRKTRYISLNKRGIYEYRTPTPRVYFLIN